MKTYNVSVSGASIRAFAVLFMTLLSAIATGAPDGFYSSKGKEVIIYHEEFDWSNYNHTVLDLRFGEEVFRAPGTPNNSMASNVYIRLRRESYDPSYTSYNYEYYGSAPNLSVIFSPSLKANTVPEDAQVQGSIHVCSWFPADDCVDISFDAIVKAIGQPHRALRTSQTWGTEDLGESNTKTTEHFDGYESVAFSKGTIAVSGGQNFSVDLGNARTDSYLFSTSQHTVTVKRK